MVEAAHLSVLVPLHNEQQNIPLFYERARTVLESLENLRSWEIVFINDGSTDGSGEALTALRKKDPRVKVITLSRNFGYHAGLVAGLSLVESDLYAIVDVDGEDPPELLKSFLEEVRRGGEVVYGIRSSREEWGVITALRSLFYHINRSIADSPAVLWMGEFSMITRQARDAILQAKTTFPFLRSEMAHIGLTRVGVAYHRGKRMSGRSHYRLWSMTRFAVAGFLSSSTFPLRLILYTAAATGVLFPLVCVILHFSWGQALLLLFLCQFYFLLFAVPMLGLYLARIYKNGIGRPVFVVDQTRTFLT